MKSNLICLFVLALFFGACGSKKQTAASQKDLTLFPVDYDYKKLEGVYSGNFGEGTIHLSIRKVTGRNAVGYSIARGLKRNFSGIMELKNGSFHLVLKEPGNNPSDGVFDIFIDTTNFNLKGKWTPRNNAALSAKEFALVKNTEDQGDWPFAVFSDSINRLTFDDDGQCTYEFYEETNGVRSNQMTTVRGNWTLKNNVYTIDWANNQIFNERRSTITIDSAKFDSTSDYFSKIIRFNNHILSVNYD